VSPVRYKLGFYIPEDYILHSHRRENLKSYIAGKCFIPYSSEVLRIVYRENHNETHSKWRDVHVNLWRKHEGKNRNF
jgi:hypothetical protein